MTKGVPRKSTGKVGLSVDSLSIDEMKRSSAAVGSDRRPLRFWQPFNDWWRSELDRLGRRPNASEILSWYNQNAYETWKDEAPSLQETRVHAKCLRSLPLVRDYFRNYRAKKRSSGAIPGEDGEEGDEEMVEGRPSDAQAPGDMSPYRNSMGQFRMQGGSPMEFIHPALPMLHPHAAALWGSQASPHLDPSQQELLRNLTLTQLQHAAAVQQQLTLAALAQQFAVSRAAGMNANILMGNERGDPSMQHRMSHMATSSKGEDKLHEHPDMGQEYTGGGMHGGHMQPTEEHSVEALHHHHHPEHAHMQQHMEAPHTLAPNMEQAEPHHKQQDQHAQQAATQAAEQAAEAAAGVPDPGMETGGDTSDDEETQRSRLMGLSQEELVDQVLQLQAELKDKAELVKRRDQELHAVYKLLHKSEDRLRQATAEKTNDLSQVLSALQQLSQQPPALAKAQEQGQGAVTPEGHAAAYNHPAAVFDGTQPASHAAHAPAAEGEVRTPTAGQHVLGLQGGTPGSAAPSSADPLAQAVAGLMSPPDSLPMHMDALDSVPRSFMHQVEQASDQHAANL